MEGGARKGPHFEKGALSPEYRSNVTVLETDLNAELHRARGAEREDTRTQSSEQRQTSPFRGSVNGSAATVQRSSQDGVGCVVVVAVEQVIEGGLRLDAEVLP